MYIPEQFAKELHDAFQGRFRIRWSEQRKEFHLEQRVAHAQVIPPPIDEDTNTTDTYNDNWIRARDGYFHVMTIRTGDRMPCPVCGHEVRVPIMETRESHCDNCRDQGLDGRYIAAFYPLNHTLISHLLDIDPHNGGPERVFKRVRAKQLAKTQKDTDSAHIEAQENVNDNKIQANAQPMVGYGPKGPEWRPTN